MITICLHCDRARTSSILCFSITAHATTPISLHTRIQFNHCQHTSFHIHLYSTNRLHFNRYVTLTIMSVCGVYCSTSFERWHNLLSCVLRDTGEGIPLRTAESRGTNRRSNSAVWFQLFSTLQALRFGIFVKQWDNSSAVYSPYAAVQVTNASFPHYPFVCSILLVVYYRKLLYNTICSICRILFIENHYFLSKLNKPL